MKGKVNLPFGTHHADIEKSATIGIGDGEAQRRFIREHELFLREYDDLHSLLKRVFMRTNRLVFTKEQAALLRASDPAAGFLQAKLVAYPVLFYLGRIAADEFNELITLCGNGMGIGAFKILRSMYERIVTIAFIAKYPSESLVFVEGIAIERQKLWRRLVEQAPQMREQYSEEQLRSFEEQYETAKASQKSAQCTKCRQPISQEQWTRVTLETMAKKSDATLAGLYGVCYVLPTFHSHTTGFGLGSRLRVHEGVQYGVKQTSERDAVFALLLGHSLILQLVVVQEAYFGLHLETEIQRRVEMFRTIWGQSPTDSQALTETAKNFTKTLFESQLDVETQVALMRPRTRSSLG
jgi:Family of unknown function (DUF5677)